MFLKITIQRILTVFLLATLIQALGLAQMKSTTRDGEGFVVNDSVKIWYKVEGADNSNEIPILLIHGGPGATARPFEKTIGPEIAKVRPVIYMDYRGAGRSDRPKDPAKYSFAILASDAEAIRESLGIEKWVVFGHSNGGATAITYALKYSSHVAALILCDPLLSPVDLEMNMIHKIALAPSDKYEQARAIYKSGESEEVRFGRLLDLIDQKTRDSFQFYNTENSSVLAGYQAELSKEIGKGLMEPALMQGLIASGFFQFDAFKSAADLTIPVLVLIGRYDSEISIDNSMKFALAVPNGYVDMMEHSGHHPYLEETRGCAEKIGSFIVGILGR
jgi:proline iminopeptidase